MRDLFEKSDFWILVLFIISGSIVAVIVAVSAFTDKRDEQNNRLFETKCEQAGFTTEQCMFFRNGTH